MINNPTEAQMRERKCKGCSRSIAHKHVNAKFCGHRCKDRYWNAVNPRGYGSLENMVERELSNGPFSNEEHYASK